MCDNCSSLSREKNPRDFKMADLHATLIRHSNKGVNGVKRVNVYQFSDYCRLYEEGRDLKAVRKRMLANGYSSREVKSCEDLYKQGLEVIKRLKERGIQHHPRKKKIKEVKNV